MRLSRRKRNRMNQWLQFVTITIRAIVFGVIMCAVLIVIISSSLLPIMNFINPPSPELSPCLIPVGSESSREELYPHGCREVGIGILSSISSDGVINALVAQAFSILLSLLGIWIASFASGLYLRLCSTCSTVKVWNSLISGFVIGIVGSIGLFLYIPGPESRSYVNDIIAYTIFGVITAVFGLAGYYVARLLKKERAVLQN